MALDPRIVLQGTNPQDISRNSQQFAARNQLMREAAEKQARKDELREVFSTDGKGIFEADPDALMRLAQVDPGLAQKAQMQAAQLDQMGQRMALAEQGQAFNQGIRTQQNARAQEAHNFAVREREIAESRRQNEEELKAYMSAKTPEEWDAQAESRGEPHMKGKFAQRDALINQQLTIVQALARSTPQKPAEGMMFDGDELVPVPGGKFDPRVIAAEAEKAGVIAEAKAKAKGEGKSPIAALEARAAAAGLTPGTPEYQAFIMHNGPPDKGMSIELGPDGSFSMVDGNVDAKPDKLTERQSQLVLFGEQMDATQPVLDELETRFDPANVGDAAAAAAGVFGNFLKSEEKQLYETAAEAWAEGVLRIQTGAAATQPEIDRVKNTYFARPGDSARTVMFKRQMREQFKQSVVAAAGGAIAPDDPDVVPVPTAEPATPATVATPAATERQNRLNIAKELSDAGAFNGKTPQEQRQILMGEIERRRGDVGK